MEPIAGNSDDSSGAVIGAVVGVCVVVFILSSAVLIVVIFVYLHTKRTQAQQQWTKDPEFQVKYATNRYNKAFNVSFNSRRFP